MPQMNPTPWLFTFIFTWTLILILSPTKTNHQLINPPTHLKIYNQSNNQWSWPWL